MTSDDQLKGAIRIFWQWLPAPIQQAVLAEARAKAMELREYLAKHRIQWAQNRDGSWSFQITTKPPLPPPD